MIYIYADSVFFTVDAGGFEMGQCILLKRVFVFLFSTVFIVECGAYDTTLEASHLSISPMHAIPSVIAHPPLSPYLSSKPLHSFAIKRK